MSIKYVSKGKRRYEESMRRFHEQGEVKESLLLEYPLILLMGFWGTYLASSVIIKRIDSPKAVETIVKIDKDREVPGQKKDENRPYAGAEISMDRNVPGQDKLPNEERIPEHYAIIPRREGLEYFESKEERGRNAGSGYDPMKRMFDKRALARVYHSPRGKGHRA